MGDQLVAWLYSTPVAALLPGPEFRIHLEWRAEAVDRWGLGSPVFSVGLRIGSPTGLRDMRGLDFFENMLPEGPALARMAVLAGARPVDTYGILEAFGRDCAGAVMVLPDGEVPGESVASGYVPMVPADLSRLIGNLDVAPLGAAPERGFRPSLAGYQRKALVGRAADGTWQLPYGDAPSTWILKPDGPQPMAANEITCLRLAAACGFAVPENELLDVAGVPVLAVKRYDRLEPATAGDVPQRLHQEDGCQATACPPGQKYEEHGGPRLRDLAVLLRDVGDPRDVTELLCRTTFNMAVGNADAHAKNFSVLHSPDALEIRLSPVYDVLSTIALELKDASGRPMRADTHMGQRVGGHADVRQVTGADIIDEAVAWGIGKRSASRVVTGTLDRVRGAIGTAQGDERVIDAIRQRTGRLLNTVTDP